MQSVFAGCNMEKLFVYALFLGILVCLVFGQGGQAFTAAAEGASEAVTLTLALVGGCALWGGLVRMADGAGLSRMLARALRRPLKHLFPGIQNDTQAQEAVAVAFAANMMGIGNAATPLSIAAMQKLKNPRDADTFWLVSASSLQILPTTVLAMRQAAGSAAPAEILPVCLICSVVGVGAAVLLRPRRL